MLKKRPTESWDVAAALRAAALGAIGVVFLLGVGTVAILDEETPAWAPWAAEPRGRLIWGLIGLALVLFAQLVAQSASILQAQLDELQRQFEEEGRIEPLAASKPLRHLVRALYTLGLAAKDRRVPWRAKFIAFCGIAYLFSPIDLIPDWIPGLGFLDDALVVVACSFAALRSVPAPLRAELRQSADRAIRRRWPQG